MAASTSHSRYLVSIPPELDAVIVAAAGDMSVPAYITTLLAKHHKVKLLYEIRRGKKKPVAKSKK